MNQQMFYSTYVRIHDGYLCHYTSLRLIDVFSGVHIHALYLEKTLTELCGQIAISPTALSIGNYKRQLEKGSDDSTQQKCVELILLITGVNENM